VAWLGVAWRGLWRGVATPRLKRGVER